MASFLDAITGLSLQAGTWAIAGAVALFVLACALIVGLGARSRLMMSKLQRRSLLGLRLLVLLLLALALMDLTTTKSEKALSVVFLSDISQSIPNEQIDKAKQFLDKSWVMKKQVPTRTMVFDRRTRQLPSSDIAPALQRLSEKPGTNIARAIDGANDLFVENTFKRAVLFSDGNQTAGDALFAASMAKSKGISIDVVPLQTQTDRDIYIESLNLPRRARQGEQINVSVTVVSNFATEATLTLGRGKSTEKKKKIQVEPGRNTVDFDVRVNAPYSTAYTASVNADGDDHAENNKLSALLRIKSNPRIAVYSGNAAGDVPMIEAFKKSKLQVSSYPIEKFPKNLGALTPFDLVVLSNPDLLGFGKEKTALLDRFVSEFGGGFLLVGGPNTSQLRPAKDDRKKKRQKLPIENILPVSLKEKKKTEPNPVALMLVIDKSASMARENKFGMAMRAAKDAIGLLGERSRLGVVLFDDFPRWAIKAQAPTDKQAIFDKLDTFGVDGGTSIYPAIQEAYAALKTLPNKVKHVIVLSDGYSTTTYDQYAHVIRNMSLKKITVSTVALGKESDKDHLRKIAKLGKGRFYYTEDISQIPKIFMEETKTITKTNVVENEFKPKLVNRGRMLKGINVKQMPSLYGYNSARSKPTSEVYLTAEKKEPLLARWRYGLGQVTFMGADSGADWARQWPDWDQYPTLWSQIARNTLGDQSRRTYRLEAKVVDDRAEVSVDALDANGSFVNDLDLTLNITPPEGEPVSVPLKQTRPGGYQGQFDMSGFGEYSFNVGGKDASTADTEGVGQVFLTPPTEFISQAPDIALLKSIAKNTGGRYDVTPEQIFEMPERTFPKTIPLWPYLLFAALGLFLASVVVRRS